MHASDMPVSDKAKSGEKCRLDEVLSGLYPNKDQNSINSMKEGIK